MQGQDLLSESIDHWGLYSFGVSLEDYICITKMQNAFGANDTQFRTAENIWAESFVAYSTQPLDSSQWIKKKRVANLNSFFKNKVNFKILILFVCPKRHFHWLWTSCNSSKSNLSFLLAKGFNLKISAFISPAVEDWINNTSLTAVFGLQKLSQIPVLWICFGKWKR